MAATDTRDSILDAVQAVIVRDGVRGTSMRQVAEEADVSVGLLSYHFDDKRTLIRAAFERATSDLLDASVQAAGTAQEPTAAIRAFIRGAFTEEFLDGDYLRLRVSLWAVALTDEEIGRLDGAFIDRYAAELRSLIAAARPDLGPAEVRGRADDVIALANGAWLAWARFGDRPQLDRGLARCESIAID